MATDRNCPRKLRCQQDGGGLVFWIETSDMVGPFWLPEGVKMIDQRYIFEGRLNNTPSYSVKKTKDYPNKMSLIQLKTSRALLREKFKLVDGKFPAKINFLKLFFLFSLFVMKKYNSLQNQWMNNF